MPAEVFPASLGNIDLVGDNAVIGRGLNTLPVALDIPDSLLHVSLDIEGEPRGFGDSETEVKSDNTRDASETDEETPAKVDAVGCGGGVLEDGAFVGMYDDEGNKSGSWNDPRSTLGDPGEMDVNIPKLPKPWAAKVAVIIRPRIRVEANSDEMTAERG